MNKEKYTKELLVMLPPSLHEQFKDTCDKNYKMISEVIREFIIKYISRNSYK